MYITGVTYSFVGKVAVMSVNTNSQVTDNNSGHHNRSLAISAI
jgi:hypothetical protein